MALGGRLLVPHQEVYPGFSWTKNFSQLLDHSAWLLPLAAVGSWSPCVADPPTDVDWLLLAAVPTTAASFAWQTAPYLYSLIPFTAVTALFAARGLSWCWTRILRTESRTTRTFIAALFALLALGELGRSVDALGRLHDLSNERQLQSLARLGEMTNPDDVVFSPWAMQVARPSAHFLLLPRSRHQAARSRSAEP